MMIPGTEPSPEGSFALTSMRWPGPTLKLPLVSIRPEVYRKFPYGTLRARMTKWPFPSRNTLSVRLVYFCVSLFAVSGSEVA